MSLSYLSIAKIHELYKTNQLTPAEAVSYYCDRIEKLNPKLNAVLDWSREKAVASTKTLGEFDDQKMLWGIPVLVKDNFVTRDFLTTASSRILENYKSPFDAAVVENLKNQGAVILGKTNLDAFAHGSSTETSDFGTTKNPWDLTKLPGGSSGGSAAAVAADLCVIAVGSETAGSVRQPASWCGCVGIKPTYGLVSRWGLILMASSTDCPGIIARSVDDAKRGLDAIAKEDVRDCQTISKTKNIKVRVKNDLNIKIKRKIRIGVCDDYFMEEAQPEINAAVLRAIDDLKTKKGYEIVKIKLIPPKYSIAVYTILQRSEVSSNLARFDGVRFGNQRSFFNLENQRRILLGTYTLSSGYYDAYYLKAVKVRTLIINDFKKAFEKVDVIIAPTSPSTALPLGSSKNHPMFGEVADVLVEASSIAQLPGINVTCGFDNHNLPIGMQIIGAWQDEESIFQVAREYENITDWQKRKCKI